MVSAPLIANFMFPVPDASLPAVEICSDKSAAGKMIQLYSTMVGAVILSSAVDDDSLSRQILETVAKALKSRGER